MVLPFAFFLVGLTSLLGVLQFSSVEKCRQENGSLELHVAVFLRYFFENHGKERKGNTPEDKNLIFVFGILKIYTDLLLDHPTVNLRQWAQNMVNLPQFDGNAESLFVEMSRAQFVLMGLRSVPPHYVSQLLFPALRELKVFPATQMFIDHYYSYLWTL